MYKESEARCDECQNPLDNDDRIYCEECINDKDNKITELESKINDLEIDINDLQNQIEYITIERNEFEAKLSSILNQ